MLVLAVAVLLAMSDLTKATLANPDQRNTTSTEVDEPVICYVDDGALVTFPAMTSSHNQQDVLNSLLFAQLAADKQYDRQANPGEWFDYFEYVVQNIGWVLTSMKYDAEVSEDYFVFSSLALNLLEKNESAGKDVEMFRRFFNALHSLPNTDRSIEVLYGKAYDQSINASSLILCSFIETPDKAVKLNLMMVGFSGIDEKVYRYLFHVFDARSLTFSKVKSSTMVLNEHTFAKVRASVLEKLGDKVKTLISQVIIQNKPRGIL